MAKNPRQSDRTTPTKSGWSKIGPAGAVIAAKAVSLLVVFVLFYVLAIFSAVTVVPHIMGFVMAGTGVTMDLPLQTVIAAWLAPSLFLIALFFTLVLIAMRTIWRTRRSLIARLDAWALERSGANVIVISGSASKPTTAALSRKTKTA